MSRIYFHSNGDTVEVRGSERAHFACLIGELFVSCLSISDWDRHILKDYLPDWINSEFTARLMLRSSTIGSIAGRDLFDLQLNTAISMGSDPIKLAAYIHGTCEVFGYFEQKDFGWVIATINQGLTSGIYRYNQGWEDVISLLESNPSEVVMSYSVTDSFPNAYLVGADDFISDSELWERCVTHIRHADHVCVNANAGLFGHETNAFQLLNELTNLSQSLMP